MYSPVSTFHKKGAHLRYNYFDPKLLNLRLATNIQSLNIVYLSVLVIFSIYTLK